MIYLGCPKLGSQYKEVRNTGRKFAIKKDFFLKNVIYLLSNVYEKLIDSQPKMWYNVIKENKQPIQTHHNITPQGVIT
jgi:hypothetical protein